MIILYKTKVNTAGNNYYIVIDDIARTFEKSYNWGPFRLYDSKVITTRRELKRLYNDLLSLGYIEKERI